MKLNLLKTYSPCINCGQPTRRRWSVDIDLPALPACDKMCWAIFWAQQQFESAEKGLW